MKQAEYELSKALMLIFLVLFAYLVSWIVLRQFLTLRLQASEFSVNMLALLVALGAGIAAYFLSSKKEESVEKKDLRIIKSLLSDDELRVIEEVERSGGIAQKSLQLRLAWSKAKLSSTLASLDRSDLIRRKRRGTEYRVVLARGGGGRT